MASSKTDNTQNDKDNVDPPDQSPSEPIPTGPLRVLVQTKTHLVPGECYGDKTVLMRDLICQHVWGRDFVMITDRWDDYGTEFGHYNQTCYFLVDTGMTAAHGETPPVDPEVIWYRWTGDTLLGRPLFFTRRKKQSRTKSMSSVRLPGEIPSKIRSKLKRFPFTKAPTTSQLPPRQPRPMRERIRGSLILKEDIFQDYIEHLEDHPEDVKWLKDNLEPKFWARLQEAGVRHPDDPTRMWA